MTSKLRSTVAADVQRMLTDVEKMGKTEEDEMSMLRTKAHVLQRVLNGFLVAPRLGSPASQGWHGWLWVARRTLEAWPCRSEPS